MMLVTAIERTKKGRFSVFCDGEFVCALHPDVFGSSPIKSGCEISPEEMEELRRQSEAKITKDRALRLLSARAYTSKGLFRKLVAYTDEDCAQAAVDRMVELGLVDDYDYARRYGADCMNLKGYSVRRTKQALMEKGIAREIIDQVAEEWDVEPEPAIAKIVIRKYMRYIEDEKGLQKMTNALLRLGYHHGDIRRVLRNLAEDPEYYENWE